MGDNSSVSSKMSLMKGSLKQDDSGNYNINSREVESPRGRSGISNPRNFFAGREGYGDDGDDDDGNQINFLNDSVHEMTWGRRIALSLMDKSWYNPRAGEDDDDQNEEHAQPKYHKRSRYGDFQTKLVEKPSLKKAWAYFEHVALDRYITDGDGDEEDEEGPPMNSIRNTVDQLQKGDHKLEKAEPGENGLKTRLYSPFFTPHSQLGDFGLGIGLYFSTLRAITVITFVAGLVSLYNMIYFASDQYMSPEARQDLPPLIQGSAVCTMTSWVPCPTCECVDKETRDSRGVALPFSRCGEAEGNSTLVFAKRNDCDATPAQLGFVNYATVIFLLLCVGYLGHYLKKQEIQFDEDEQTAQDYSIKISNPPDDANDPEEWRRFFYEVCDGAQLTVCTCAVDNDFLIQTLLERREKMRTIENMLEPGTSMTTLSLAKLASEEERNRGWFARVLSSVSPGIPELYSRVVALNAKVQGLAQLEYPVTNIFLTFETEADQRKVLERLSVGSLSAQRNDVKSLADPKYLFRGKHVLDVSEPDEPNTIRWQDLNVKIGQIMKTQCMTVIATLVAIIAVAIVVSIANDASTFVAALAISVFNSAFPMFAKLLTDVEAHASEGQKQTSLYFKIAAFRWVNTAIVITIITPFTGTLELTDGLIPQIYTLFFTEIVTTNVIQLIDPMGHINRHVLAPRATTQDAMNLKFEGQEFELAERYTDMTKILFLCVWYCSIYPAAFFLCAVALFIKYYVDRFSLMRTWKRPPQLGTRISKFSRRYFFSLACIAMAVISSYYWSGFPFDNLCANDSISPSYLGNFTIRQRKAAVDDPFALATTAEGDDESEDQEDEEIDDRDFTEVIVTSNDIDYRYCNQDMLMPGGGGTFPFIPSKQPEGDEWMTDDQETVTRIFGWSSIVISVVVILRVMYGWVGMAKSLFASSYKAVGDDQGIPFSEVASRSAYIPQVRSPLFSYPLIACNSQLIDEELFDWTDPDRPFSWYDLSQDAARLLDGIEVEDQVCFTVVKYWPRNAAPSHINIMKE